MHDGEVRLIEEIELNESWLRVISLEAVHHVLIFELCVWGVVVYDREKGVFIAEQAYDVIIGWWSDALNFLLKAVFFEDDHFVLEDITIILFQKLFIGEVDAKLF